MSFAAEVIADDSGKFCGNGLRFATTEEASTYARDLEARWILVRKWRVVPSEDPVTHVIHDNRMERVQEAQPASRSPLMSP